MDGLEDRVAKRASEREQSAKVAQQSYQEGRRQYHAELHEQIDKTIRQIIEKLNAADWPDAEIIRLGFFRIKKVVAQRFSYIDEYNQIRFSYGESFYYVGRDGNLYEDFVDANLGHISGAAKINYRRAEHASTLREYLMSLRHLLKSL